MLKLLLYRIIIVLLFLCIHSSPVIGQHEYLVTVNPSNGVLNKIDSIPGVMYIELFRHTTFDETNNRFIFVGLPPDQSTQSLISLDAVTGKIVSKAPVPKNPTMTGLRYAASLHTLYGLTISSGTNYALVSVDVNSGAYTTLTTIGGVQVISDEIMIDNNNHRLFLNCLDTGGGFSLACIDAVNGNIISRVPFKKMNDLQYDNTTNKLYGLYGMSGQWQLAEVSISTGLISVIGNLPPDLSGILQGNSTFDEKNHRFIFAGADNGGTPSLYSIDAATGTVIYKTPVPASSNNVDKDNVIQFRYSNSLNQLYALHWKAHPDTVIATSTSSDNDTKVYTSSQGGNLLIYNKPTTSYPVRMSFYTTLGQVIIENRLLTEGLNKIALPTLASGIYFYKLYSANGILRSGKVFINR